jgi:hypothetical protein
MIEAGEPSTGPFRDRDIGSARPTGDSYGRITGNLAQRTTRQSESRAKEAPQRGHENYKGRSPVGHRPRSTPTQHLGQSRTPYGIYGAYSG